MNIEEIERNLNSHRTDIVSLLSALLETEIENQALLRVILINQAYQAEKDDPSRDAVHYENEFIDSVNKLKNEKLAEIIKYLSK